MMSLIKDNKLGLLHFFRQSGFGESCVADDFKKITLHNIEPNTLQTDSVIYFKVNFPILFKALFSMFELIPSTTRIVEQKHGQLRDSI